MPTIFNVLMDAVVRHWEFLVAERVGGGSSNNYGNNSQLVGGQYVKGTASDGKRRRGMHS